MLRPFKKSLEKHVRAGVMLDNSRAGLARVHRRNDGSLSLAARVFEAAANDEWPDHADSHVSGMNLQRTPVSAVLPANAYQLLLVELPNVPTDELLAAVRWRIKDLIDFPLEEAAVELLEMPRYANRGHAPIAYAVVSRRDQIVQQIEMMKSADLQMDVIDIPELCMRNIAVLLPQDEFGVAFLHFSDDCGYLTVTHKGVLHMLRRLESGRNALAKASTEAFALQERVAGIALEVQRSLDYYESHYDRRPISEIILGPGVDLDALPAAMTEALGLTVSRLSFDELFSMEHHMSAEEQGDCLLAVGAALRTDPSTRQAASQ